jgi:hypothetical protein
MKPWVEIDDALLVDSSVSSDEDTIGNPRRNSVADDLISMSMAISPTSSPVGVAGTGAGASVKQVLKAVVPGCSSAVRERLRQKRILDADDLARLDKADLRELGFSRVERRKVLEWSQEFRVQAFSTNAKARIEAKRESLRVVVEDVSAKKSSTPMRRSSTPTRDQDMLAFLKRPSQRSWTKAAAGGQLDQSTGMMEVLLRHLDDVESRAGFWSRHLGPAFGAAW